MPAFSVWHLVVLVVTVLNVAAFWRLLPKARIPGWLAILAILPFVAEIYLWIVAFGMSDDPKA
jgi:hypothetical protein